MKFSVCFKTPDVLDYVIKYMSEDEREEAEALAKKFIEYGEEIVIEFDTETQTATVVPLRKR